EEIAFGLTLGNVKVVVDSESELELVRRVAEKLERRAKVLLRVTPGVEPDTHHYIRTGQGDSKFGVPLEDVSKAAAYAREHARFIELLGLHSHIGSQSHELDPYLEIVEILADCFADLNDSLDIELSQLDLGGGLGIAYTEKDRPLPILEWSRAVANRVTTAFRRRALPLPTLLLEPGRAIVGTAGVTLYTAGHLKSLPGGLNYLAVDGGMADNPRPVTYQARYTPCIANRMNSPEPPTPVTIVGKYCESGDIIIRDAYLAA